jgi:hypothetical protein
MATDIIRPTSASGTSWNNLGNIYDTDSSTAGTVSVKSSTYNNRKLTTNWTIPTNAIKSATLTIRAKKNTSNRNIALYVDINGDSSKRVMTQDTTTTATDYTVDITSHIGSISTITVLGYATSSSNATLSIYDMYITVVYDDSGGGGETSIQNIKIGQSNINTIYLGTTKIVRVYVGDTLVYGE